MTDALTIRPAHREDVPAVVAMVRSGSTALDRLAERASPTSTVNR